MSTAIELVDNGSNAVVERFMATAMSSLPGLDHFTKFVAAHGDEIVAIALDPAEGDVLASLTVAFYPGTSTARISARCSG